jgi:hypothetical protein
MTRPSSTSSTSVLSDGVLVDEFVVQVGDHLHVLPGHVFLAGEQPVIAVAFFLSGIAHPWAAHYAPTDRA